MACRTFRKEEHSLRYASKKHAVLTAVLTLVCTAVLAAVLPVSARADNPVAGDPSTTIAATVPAPELPPEIDPILLPSALNTLAVPPALPASKSFVVLIKKKMRRLRSRVLYYQRAAESWARIMGLHAKPVSGRRLAIMSLPALQKKAAQWKRKAAKTRIRAQNPPHLADFMCIHHYEGSWKDSGAPYYGGLQMDLGFQRTYAPNLLRTKGTADHWSPLEQIWTAEKAASSRGFYPWPNTARSCGLL